MSNIPTYLLIVGILLILALSGYAAYLWRKVWQQKQAFEAAETQRQQRLAGDLRILAQSLLSEDLPMIEGSIRIKVLLDNYNISLSNDPHCEVFHLVFDATSGIPTHAGWKALSRAERQQHQAHFSELELQHKAAARKGARWLLDEALPAQPQAH